MKSVAIFYFSGTGNTEIVANMVKEEFSYHDYHVDMVRMEDVLKKKLKLEINKYDLIGIGAQVLGYGVPNLVYSFLKSIPKENNKKVFIFRTAGGVAPQNYNASKPIIRRLKKKGYDVFYERIFSIASNWVERFNDEAIRQLHGATRKKVGIMCKEIMRGEKRILKTSLGKRIIMEFLAFSSRWAFYIVGKDLTVSNSCTNCGLCIRNCPAENIHVKNGKIKFRLSCNSCMRCIYSCPQNAINFKRLKFFTLPEGYNIKKTLEIKCSNSKESKGSIPKFLNDYLSDDNL